MQKPFEDGVVALKVVSVVINRCLLCVLFILISQSGQYEKCMHLLIVIPCVCVVFLLSMIFIDLAYCVALRLELILQVGSISDVVYTDSGVHIIKRTH